jgi:hypothetical protein
MAFVTNGPEKWHPMIKYLLLPNLKSTNIHLRNARTPQEVNRLFNEVRPNGACTPIEARIEALVSYQ